MPNTPIERDVDTVQLTESVQQVEPQQYNVNRLKLPEALLDNPNIADCVSEMPHQPDVCLHDTDNCNQPARKTVPTSQMS